MQDLAADRIVLKSSRFVSFLVMIFFGLLVPISLLITLTDPFPLLMGWISVIMFSVLAVMGLLQFVRGIPKIELTPDGVTYTTAFRTRRWSWSEVGPFVLVDDYYGALSPRHQIACAFLQRHHDLLASNQSSERPCRDTADIKLALRYTGAGRTQEDAQDFVTTLNAWRERYRQAEVRRQETPVHFAQFQRTLLVRRKGQWVAIGVLCVLVFVGHVFIFPAIVERLSETRPGDGEIVNEDR